MDESIQNPGACAAPAGKLNFQPSLPVMVKLAEKRCETQNTVSLLFEHPSEDKASFRPLQNAPGQFVMVWLPELNEKPFVISYISDTGFGITVTVRGNFSRRLSELQIGQKAGCRGPFGRGFSGMEDYAPEKIAILGGGCGMASLALLAQKIPEANIIQGAPSSSELLYAERFPRQIIFTEDGSFGFSGRPTQWLEGKLSGGVEMLYTCGPEIMMKKVVSLCNANGIRCQAALERYMKCGIGVCGQCECDGRLVCRDGPVFSDSELQQMPSFGNTRRNAAGQRIKL